MDKLDKDFVSLVSRRAYDVAGCSAGVKVYLNDELWVTSLLTMNQDSFEVIMCLTCWTKFPFWWTFYFLLFLKYTRLPIKTFKDYVRMFTSKCISEDSDTPLPVIHEVVNPRWEIACCPSPEGEFRQMSFVNKYASDETLLCLLYNCLSRLKGESDAISRIGLHSFHFWNRHPMDHNYE